MLLKGSQVTSLQQRELTIQKKLYQILLHVYENISIQFTIPLPSVPNSNFQSTTSCPTSSSSSVASLPELLNITRNCFEDIIKWEGQLKFNQLQPSKRVYEEDEDESPLTQRSIEKGVTSQREQFFRRKPPTIPRR